MNREERELLNHLFDSLPAGILYFDQNFHLKLVNGPGQEFLDFWRRVDPDAEAKAIPHQFKEMVQHAFTTTAGSEADLSWSQRHYNVKVTPVDPNRSAKNSWRPDCVAGCDERKAVGYYPR